MTSERGRGGPPRRVDWPILVGPKLRPAVPRPARGLGVVSVLAAADELVSYRDRDTVLRRAVELLRDRIGLERTAIFMLGPDDLLYGTWGTGLAGETTNERHICFSMGVSHREAFARARSGAGRWLLLEDCPLTAQLERQTKVVDRGWIAITPIVSVNRALGVLANDTALSGRCVDEAAQAQAAVFCSLLSNILELRRQDLDELPWRPVYRNGTGGVSEIVARAVRLLNDDLATSRAALGRQLGVSPGRLGKLFKAEMGVSLIEYRNRLRIERFLALVERGGGNLLGAALDAGFGSYAQFHRVFRGLLGTTPKEYLTGAQPQDPDLP